jgi:hypothetical protein
MPDPFGEPITEVTGGSGVIPMAVDPTAPAMKEYYNQYRDVIGDIGQNPWTSGAKNYQDPLKQENAGGLGPLIGDQDGYNVKYKTGQENMTFFNIDDPTVPAGYWETNPMALTLDPKDITPKQITCESVCQERAKIRKENCKALRERVATALKVAGCPTKLVPIPEKTCKYSSATRTVASTSSKKKKK